MAGQIAKLFIRGRLVNETAKNLNEEQKQKAMELMEKAWNDPNLSNPRYEFCMALARTIGNEYKNLEFGMQEIWVTFWRCAVDALYHTPLQSSYKKTIQNEDGENVVVPDEEKYQKALDRWESRKEKLLTNSIIRKKHFQTWMFNYLRQILLENKIPQTYINKELVGPADVVATDYIKLLLDTAVKQNYGLEQEDGKTTFHVSTNSIPVEVLQKVWKIRDEVAELGVDIKTGEETITLEYEDLPGEITKKINERIRINAVSLNLMDNDESNNFQQFCEYQGTKRRQYEVDHMMTEDAVAVLKNRLPEQAKEVLGMLLEPSNEFLDTYYPNRKKTVIPKECHLAKWFGMSRTEMSKTMNLIRKQAKALDIGA